MLLSPHPIEARRLLYVCERHAEERRAALPQACFKLGADGCSLVPVPVGPATYEAVKQDNERALAESRRLLDEA